VTDDALRASERALVTEPADLDLRRRHARLLQRAGQSDRALSALDLAWRLGADELWDELRAALDTRAVRAGGLELRYVPAGPFVMGSDDHDDDAKPAHLVELSAFYLSSRPLPWQALQGTSHWEEWMDRVNEAALKEVYEFADFDEAEAIASEVYTTALEAAVPGARCGLPTEAQWERAQRAGLLRADGVGPYGIERPLEPEWTADRFALDAYELPRRLDPSGPTSGKLRVVRGVPLPPPLGALYREAAKPDRTFEVATRDENDPGRPYWRRRRNFKGPIGNARSFKGPIEDNRAGIVFRLCLVPGARP